MSVYIVIFINMKNLNAINYCLSCEHVMSEQGFVFTFDENIAPNNSKKKNICLHCGQVLEPEIEKTKNDCNTFLTALKNPKLKVVCFIAPSVRVGIGECFNLSGDYLLQTVTALKKLGADSVFSMNFAADLTIKEESKEFLERIYTNTNIPMFTSCCPTWVNYIYKAEPTIKSLLSTCKSPQQMMGSIINTYYANKTNTKSENLFVVSIVPCLAKKIERARQNVNISNGYDVDACITTVELAEIIKSKNIRFADLPETQFDSMFNCYSSDAAFFGASGGVSSAIINNIGAKVLEINTKEDDAVVEMLVKIKNKDFWIAKVCGLANVRKIIQDLKNNKCKYSLVEVMACDGGCIGGTGQPKTQAQNLDKRRQLLKVASDNQEVKNTEQNTILTNIYNEFITDDVACKLLHETRK